MTRRCLLGVLVIVLFFSVGLAQAAAPVLTHLDTNDKVIALTFDDGWDSSTCEKVRLILLDHEVVATIFPVASWAEGHHSLIKRFLADGHELGNHTMTHAKLTMLSLVQQEQELREAHEILAKLGGQQLTGFFRPPYGSYDKNTLKVAAKLGLRPVTWSIDSWDWRDVPTQQVVQRTLERARPGGVILMHLAARNTVHALPQIISGLKERGYNFVPLSVLFADHLVVAPISPIDRHVHVTYQGELIELKPAAKLVDGVTMVPCREFFQHFGWRVCWDAKRQLAVCQLAEAQILVQAENNSIQTCLTGRLENGKLYVPLRALATELNFRLGWDAATYTANLR